MGEGPPGSQRGAVDPRDALWHLGRDGVAEIDRHGRIAAASPAFLRALRYVTGEIEGKMALDLVHPEERRDVAEWVSGDAASGTGAQLVVRLRAGNGEWRWFELTATPRPSEGTAGGRLWIGCDVSDRVRAERALEAQAAVEQRIAELASRFLTLPEDDFAAGMERGLQEAAELAGADRAQFFALGADGEGVRAYHQWCAAGLLPRDPGSALHEGRRAYPWAAGQLLEGRTVQVERVADLPREAEPERRMLEAEGTRSYLGIPVRHDGHAVGFLDFHRILRGGGWSEQETTRLRLVAEILASAWRRQRSALRQQRFEERLRALSEDGRDVICEMTWKGRVVYVSPNVTRLMGYTQHELRRLDPYELVHPDDLRALGRARERWKGAPEIEDTVRYRVRHRDGRWRWLETTVRSFRNRAGSSRVVLVVRDVSAEEQRREELERKLELERRIAEFTRRFLAWSDAEIDEGIRSGLEATAGLVGADRAFLVSSLGGGRRRSFDWCAPDVPPRANRLGRMGSEEQRDVEEQLRHGETVRIPVVSELPDEAAALREGLVEAGVRSFLAIPVLSGERLVGVIGFHCMRSERDWSEEQLALLRLVAEAFRSALHRKRAEEQLRLSQQQLLQSQKLEAVGTLAGGIAHDFNNQLTVILGNARHALRHSSGDPELAEALADLERAAEHCADLTRALLAFSRRAAVEPRRIELRQVLRDSAELIRPMLPRGVTLHVGDSDAPSWVEADPTQLQQVLVNLALNARDAMTGGGELAIGFRSRRLDAAASARLGLASPGDYLELYVEDTGHGFDDDVRARIFEPFFTTKEPGKGTGLGLATVYGIVRDSKGGIEVESQLHEGSVFRVLLPRAETDEDAPVEATAETEEHAATVLLVEDEPAVRRFAARALRAGGFLVLEAADGADALGIGEVELSRIDVLLADVDMPRIGGIDLARQLTTRRPDLPVLFLSGYANVPLEGPDAPIPAARFLGKPFAEEDLQRAVRELIDTGD